MRVMNAVSRQGRESCKRLATFGLRLARDWRREILAALAPVVLLDVLVRGPEIPAVLRLDASIGTIAAVQGAVTGLSLIALVLAVELARRQEDRDDTVYEIMLRAAWIRPTFTFALAALLATLAAVAIADFSVVAQGTRAANLLLCAYVLTGGVGIALLVTVLRTVRVLRPTGVIEYRFHANDQERRAKVSQFISKSLNEFPKLGPVERLMLPHRPVGLTATERLFSEVDDAIHSGQAARFSGAIERLRNLIDNSAEQIGASAVGFQPPGQPTLGYWFPLDALQGRLDELWAACFSRQGYEFEREMWSLEYWLVMKGVERRSGELLEVGLRCGLLGYQAGRETGRSSDHARHEWMNLKGAAWWRLIGVDGSDSTPSDALFIRRLIEHFQEYGNMLLKADDADSFRDLLAEFRQSFHDDANRRWRFQSYLLDLSAPLSNVEYAIMASLALGGRAMTLKEQGKLREIGGYLDAITEMVGQSLPLDRFISAASSERETKLHQQWSWWEMETEEGGGTRFRWTASEQYVMLPLLLNLLKSESDQPLASLDGLAQRFIDAWNTHKDLLMDLADVDPLKRQETANMFTERLATSKSAEEREKEDFYINASQDPIRVGRFLAKLRAFRKDDRLLERSFDEAGRVRRLAEQEWSDKPRLGFRALVPREPFVKGVVHSTFVEELDAEQITYGFEGALIVKLAEVIERTSDSHQVPDDDLDQLVQTIDRTLVDVREGRRLIVFVGRWSHELYMEVNRRKWSDDHPEFTAAQMQHRFAVGSFRESLVLRIDSNDDRKIAVLNVDRWGRIDRATTNGEDIEARFAEIEPQEAERRARAESIGSSSIPSMDRRVRELRLKVSVEASERVDFDVESPDAARIVRVASGSGDDDQDDR